MTQDQRTKLSDWEEFVLQHRHPMNVRLHFISFLMFWLGPALALVHSPWWWIAFFSSGLVGTLGHHLFEKASFGVHDAAISPRVVLFSSKMAWLFMRGRYHSEIGRVEKRASAPPFGM